MKISNENTLQKKSAGGDWIEAMATGSLQRPLNTRFDRQWNEAEVIRSIYYDEFEEVRFPWKSDHLPCFTIHLDEVDLEGAPLQLDIQFVMKEGYPEERPPEMKLVKRKGLTNGQIQSLEEKLKVKADGLLGDEMCYEIIEEAKALLSVMARKKVSFHDEMVSRQAIDLQQTKEAQMAAQALKHEEDEVARQKVMEELDAKMKVELEARQRLLEQQLIAEDQLMNAADNLSSISKIQFVPELQFPLQGHLTTVNTVTVKPNFDPIQWTFGEIHQVSTENGAELSLLIVKFSTPFYYSSQGRRKLMALVRSLADIAKGLPEHPGLSRILGGQLDFSSGQAVLHVLCEPIRGLSFESLLNQSGSMSLAKSVNCTKAILTTLGHLHLNGIIHKDLCLANLFMSPNGSSWTLAFAHLSASLVELDQVHPISSISKYKEMPMALRPPEALSKNNIALGRKTDIWCVGVVLLQLLLGTGLVANEVDTMNELINCYRERFPKDLLQFLLKVTHGDAERRPKVSELLRDNIFNPITDLNGLISTGLTENIDQQKKFTWSGPKDPIHYSRYRSDFEEIQFLGKGAFGAVIKVRNRIDNRFYAVKRIRLDPKSSEENQKILREVTTLSRLHNDRIIRYFQAWIEGAEEDPSKAKANVEDVTESMQGISFREESEDDFEYKSNENWLESTYDAQFDTLHSNSSLLDLAINHTGFSDTEEPRVIPRRNSPISKEVSSSFESSDDSESEENSHQSTGPFLYIQMEYCPNQTLRDYIDEGSLDLAEVWRLFRQILEGLAYIHSQGLIHRDLKPSNIFLDSNGDIKIGDFGLAVADAVNRGDEGEMKVGTKSAVGSLSLTGAVGTPFYMSPEQEQSTRYSSKVDMYSAGIIFVELCCGAFPTAMERVDMLKSVRKLEINLPKVFSTPEYATPKTIALSLLSHDPANRLSAEDLISRSDLLPAKLEDESVKQAIKSLTLPGSIHFNSLINALFERSMEPFKDFTFDLQAKTIQDPVLLSLLVQVKARLVNIFQYQGAIELNLPLLTPSTDIFKSPFSNLVIQNDAGFYKVPSRVIDPSGSLIELPSDLFMPFARFVAHNRIVDMKRWAFELSFSKSGPSGHPIQQIEAAFDIVHPLMISPIETSIAEARVIKVAYDSATCHLTLNPSVKLWIHLSSELLLRIIAKYCGVFENQCPALQELLSKTVGISWIKRKNILMSSISLSHNICENLSKFSKPMTLEKIGLLLKQELEFQQALQKFTEITNHLDAFGLDINRILIDPFFVLPPLKYNGVFFGLCVAGEKKTLQVLAVGGRYDAALAAYAYPRPNQSAAVGFRLNISKLIQIKSSVEQIKLLEVLIVFPGPGLINDVLAIVSECWSASIKADFIMTSNANPDYLHKMSKRLGVSLIVILRDHASKGNFGTVRVREIEKKQDTEVYRNELIETLTRMLHSEEENLTTANTHQLDFEMSNVSSSQNFVKVHLITTGNTPSKMKPSQKSQITDRALKAFESILQTMNPAAPLEIIAHELSSAVVKSVMETLDRAEEAFRKAIESHPGCREVGTRLRTHLKSLKERGDTIVFFYNYHDSQVDIIPFTK